MEGCWCLCVWRSARGPRELVNASLPELLASVGAVTRHPTNWAAANEALLVKGLDPAVCWTRFSSHQVARQAAERCVLLHAVVEVWATGNCTERVIDFVRSQLEEWDACSGLLPLASWEVEVVSVSRRASDGRKAGGKKSNLDSKRVVDAFRKVGVGSRPATDSPTLVVVVLYDGAIEMAVWVGPVLGWGCRHKRRWEHEYGTPTSMGPVEAMMTAGLAGVRPGKTTLDPFCGGGALLAAAACLGADSLCGGDVNGAHLQVDAEGGTSSSVDVKRYTPDMAIMSAFNPAWRADTFDVMLCDPPYGVRAGVVTDGAQADGLSSTAVPREGFHEVILVKLFALARRLLREDGRLVTWMPLDPTRPLRCVSPSAQHSHPYQCSCSMECQIARDADDAGLTLCTIIREERQTGLQRAVAVLERRVTYLQRTIGETDCASCVTIDPDGALDAAPPPPHACRPPNQPGSCATLPAGDLPSRLHNQASTSGHHRLDSYADSKASASGLRLDVWRAAWVGDVKGLAEYLSAGGDVDQLDAKGQTPLQYACGYGRLPACRLLIHNGANVAACADRQAQTPLHRAATWGHADVVEALLQTEADPLMRDSKGRCALHLAAYHGHTAALMLLIASMEAEAVETADKEGFTALHLSARWGEAESVGILLQAGAQVMRVGGSRNLTAAHLAARWGHRQVLELLFSHTADVAAVCNARCSLGTTPLMVAEEWKRQQCVEYLEGMLREVGNR